MDCPCNSEKNFETCCRPILEGQPAETAEQLMRARYTAYTRVDMDFIAKTHDPKTIKKTDMKENQAWAEQTQWNGLEIVSTKQGKKSDDWGEVEFKAQYSSGQGSGIHHEVSEFCKRDGFWFFNKGKTPENFQIVNTEPRVGRNDPCICGSGKKYKKCCG
ncbi:MAG: YchJ family protein [Pseudomonadota bacterium]